MSRFSNTCVCLCVCTASNTQKKWETKNVEAEEEQTEWGKKSIWYVLSGFTNSNY